MYYSLQTRYDLTILYPPECSEEEQARGNRGAMRAQLMAPMQALELMAICGQDKLLAHPVCTSLLERKW